MALKAREGFFFFFWVVAAESATIVGDSKGHSLLPVFPLNQFIMYKRCDIAPKELCEIMVDCDIEEAAEIVEVPPVGILLFKVGHCVLVLLFHSNFVLIRTCHSHFFLFFFFFSPSLN